MNFQQLRIIREAVRQDFNLTTVAGTLFTSQPGVSKHIKDLEDELGVEIFVRRGKRLLGLTDPGKELLAVVERILLDTQNARSIADQFSNKDSGNLVIARRIRRRDMCCLKRSSVSKRITRKCIWCCIRAVRAKSANC